jgi:cytochrome P450
MMLLLLSALFTAAAGFIGWVWYCYSKKSATYSHPLVKNVPGIPILGNILDFSADKIINTMLTYPNKFKTKFLEVYFLNQRGLIITDLAISKEILIKRPKKFRRTSLLDFANKLMGTDKGLFSSEGKLWVRLRKLTSPSFNTLHLSSKYSLIIKEIVNWMMNITERSSSSSSSGSSNVINMKVEAFQLTLRIITIVAFGLEQNDPLNTYFFKEFNQDLLILFSFITESLLFPLPLFVWKMIPKYSKVLNDAMKANERFTVACQAIINKKRALLKERKLEMNCMIDSLIAISGTDEKEGISGGGGGGGGGAAGGGGLTDEEIIANIKVFYVAGSDTTAVVLSWLLYHFAVNPSLIRKIREEVLTTFFPSSSSSRSETDSDSSSSIIPSLKDFLENETLLSSTFSSVNKFKEMKYTQAIVKEGLRLKSPASQVFLESLPDIAVSSSSKEEEEESADKVKSNEYFTLSNGIKIGPQEIVIINTDVIHLDPLVFSPTPEEFLPERWLTNDKEQLTLMENHFLPFGFGPRICPGMNLALNELMITISLLSLYFDSFSLGCIKDEIFKISNFIISPNKMPIIFHKRDN